MVEVLVLLLILLMFAMAGWFIWNRNQNNESESQTNVQVEQQESSNQAKLAPKPQFFEIKELNVKFETSDKLNGIYYIIGNENNTAYFSLEEFKSSDCAADKIAQYALTRYSEEDLNNEPTEGVVRKHSKKVGNYYYFGSGGQAACTEDPGVQEKFSELRMDLTMILPDSLLGSNE